VLWVIRDCLSGLVLLARALLSSACGDLAGLLREVAADLAALGVPVDGVVSDGQPSIRLAIARVWPDVPHQLCHFHYPARGGPAGLRGRPARPERVEEGGARGSADRAHG
jgi:hypothetical protein